MLRPGLGNESLVMRVETEHKGYTKYDIERDF